MAGLGMRWLAAAAVLGFAALFTGLGVALSTADEPMGPDLSELRDAVKAASKRGDNVLEIRKALDALEKSLAKGWTAPKPGTTVPAPAELTALRDAVEAALKKGENVEAISKELEAVEKAMTGKAFVRPLPPPPVDLPARPPVRPGLPPLPFQFPQPAFPGGGIDRELLQKAQELRLKALELMQKNPTDAEALKLMEEAQELMLKAMLAGGGINPGLMLPDLGRAQDRYRLGIRMERLAPITAEQLGLDAQGVAIVSVVPGSAADKAGFKMHDIVLEFAGKAISDNPEDLGRRVNEVKAGQKVDAVVMRKGKKVEIKGIELPDMAQINPRLDIQPFPLPDIQPFPLPRPNIKPLPAPMLPKLGVPPGGLGVNPLPAFPNPFNPIPMVQNDGDGNTLSVAITNDQFVIKATRDGVKFVITGTKGDNGPVTDKVTIIDGDKTHEAAKLDAVPKQYAETVEKLLKSVSGR
jgi:serine protease Do